MQQNIPPNLLYYVFSCLSFGFDIALVYFVISFRDVISAVHKVETISPNVTTTKSGNESRASSQSPQFLKLLNIDAPIKQQNTRKKVTIDI